jgi:dihydrofolate reductase
MPELKVLAMTMSVDGYVAGPNQSIDHGLGEGGENLHKWMLHTRGWKEEIGESGGDEGVDNDYFHASFENIGAFIMGRNMFGPIRGEWGDEEWKGWWGDNPPYHHPVFVLTHYAREPLEMDGDNTFIFTDEPIDVVLKHAFEAAQGKDVRLSGGASTVRQYLAAGLVDSMHLPISPVLLGGGERLFADDLGNALNGYEVTKFDPTPLATHVMITRKT